MGRLDVMGTRIGPRYRFLAGSASYLGLGEGDERDGGRGGRRVTELISGYKYDNDH